MTPLLDRPTYATSVACLFTLAVFAPTLFAWNDSFPLSTYPMFAKHRGRPEMVKLVATTAEGSLPVRPELLGTGEVLQAKVLLERIAVGSAAARRKFCEQTAERLSALPEAAAWQEIRLVRVKFDPIDYFYNGAQPMSEKVLNRCSMHGDERAEEPPQ